MTLRFVPWVNFLFSDEFSEILWSYIWTSCKVGIRPGRYEAKL